MNGLEDVIGLGFAAALGVIDRQADGLDILFLFDLLKSVNEFAFLVGFLVLHGGAVEEEGMAVDLHGEVVEEAVGLHVVEHVSLPEEDDILLVGVNPLVNAHVLGRVGEADGAAAGEVAGEKGMELVEQFLAEFREGFDPFVDFLKQGRLHRLAEPLRLDSHQVDVAGFSLHLRTDEEIAERIEETAFLGAGLECGIVGHGANPGRRCAKRLRAPETRAAFQFRSASGSRMPPLFGLF